MLRSRAVALGLLFALLATHAHATDYFLSTPDEATMETDLASTPFRQSTGGDFSNDFNDDFGSGNGVDYVYYGTCPSGSSWRLKVIGTLLTPQIVASGTNLEPYEPGNFTSNVGKPIWPPVVVNPLNPAVGIQSVPDTVSNWWLALSWNCPEQMPNLGALGITVTQANTAGAAALVPYGVHF